MDVINACISFGIASLALDCVNAIDVTVKDMFKFTITQLRQNIKNTNYVYMANDIIYFLEERNYEVVIRRI